MESNDNRPRRSVKNLEKIKDALMDGSKPASPKKQPAKSAGDVVSINGDGNILGNGNHVTTINNPSPTVTIVKVQTGVGVLTAAQKAKINALIAEWVEARGAVRRSKAEIAALRKSFNNAMKVNSYAEILQGDFERAMTWLRRQTGIINSMPSARAKLPDWRKKRYTSINARAKEFSDGELRYRNYAQERFGTGSLKELNDDQLDAVYRHVFGWPRVQ